LGVNIKPDGSIDRYKARLVVMSYSWKPGIDCNGSPVARYGTIQTVLSVAACEGMQWAQFDGKPTSTSHKALMVAVDVDDGLVESVECFLGMQIMVTTNKAIFVGQETHSKQLMGVAKSIARQGFISEEEVKVNGDQAVGSLKYLAVATSQNIDYVVNIVSQSLENPTQGDWNNIKSLLVPSPWEQTIGIPGMKVKIKADIITKALVKGWVQTFSKMMGILDREDMNIKTIE